MCASLFSWINDGSHSAHDDIYLAADDNAVQGYLRVFAEVFEKTGHVAHYRMMMRLTEEDVEEAAEAGTDAQGGSVGPMENDTTQTATA